MTGESALVWSIGRCLLLATVALPLSMLIPGCWQRLSGGPVRGLVILVAVLPLFVPDLLTGFTYRLTSARLLHSDLATEALYAGLLLTKLVALQIAVHLILPDSAISRESLHSWKLVSERTGFDWGWLRMQFSGPLRASIIAWLAGALLCFQEFETAALLQINQFPKAWTVWLFDAHAAGEPLGASLRHVRWSMLFQGTLLLPALVLIMRGRNSERLLQTDATGSMRPFPRTRLSVFSGTLLILLIVFVTSVWPLIVNGGQIAGGLSLLVNQGILMSRTGQILQSLSTSILAAVLAIWICAELRITNRWWTIALLIPGLSGSLVLGLVLLAVFQLPALHFAYDTMVPMLLGQTLWLMPRAWLIVTLLDVISDREAVHSAKLSLAVGDQNSRQRARRTLWQLSRRRWIIAVAILSHWSFWDVSIVSLLRPVRFEPIVTRLYNEMHYGRTDSLIAITVLAIVAPGVLAVIVSWLVKRIALSRRSSE